MRKVKKGSRFLEYGTKMSQIPFHIVSMSGKTGFCTTDRGTKIRISRLLSTKYYKAL